jgi:hypothetical protein
MMPIWLGSNIASSRMSGKRSRVVGTLGHLRHLFLMFVVSKDEWESHDPSPPQGTRKGYPYYGR